jgi:hypothetical protein
VPPRASAQRARSSRAVSARSCSNRIHRSDVDLRRRQRVQQLGHRADAVGALHQEPGLPGAQVEAERARGTAQRGAAFRNQIELPFAAIGKSGKREQIDALGGETGQHLRATTRLVGHHHVKVIDFAHTLAHVDSFACTAGVETLQRPTRRVNGATPCTARRSGRSSRGRGFIGEQTNPQMFRLRGENIVPEVSELIIAGRGFGHRAPLASAVGANPVFVSVVRLCAYRR